MGTPRAIEPAPSFFRIGILRRRFGDEMDEALAVTRGR